MSSTSSSTDPTPLERAHRALRWVIAAGAIAWLAAAALHHAFDIHWLTVLPELPLCPFRTLTDIPCPSCGTTRALLLLAEFRVSEALTQQPALPLILAVLLGGLWPPRRFARSLPTPLAGVLLATILAIWATRLLHGATH